MCVVAILKDCTSKFVVATHDIFETTRFLYIVLEFMEGGSLYDILEANKSLSEHHSRIVMRQVLAGILYLQSRGTFHFCPIFGSECTL